MLRNLLLLSALFLPVTVFTQQNEVKKERENLKGAWVIESMELNGKIVESSKGDVFTFSADRITLKTKVKEAETKGYKLDPTKKPKEIDIIDPQEKPAVLGIYHLEGDTLKLCIAVMGKRPTAFDSSQGILGILKRVKQ